MADYFTHTVIVPEIPVEDISKDDLNILKQIFEYEEDDNKIYLFSTEQRNYGYTVENENGEILHTLEDRDIFDIFSRIIHRSNVVNRIEIRSAFTCSKMRSDGFGGSVTIIEADNILTIDTFEHYRV